MREFHNALSSTKETAPGEDNIIYAMIKHLPDDAKEFLLDIFNEIWVTGVLPKSWKVSLIIPCCKPGKNCLHPTSYRPLALTSCLCKLMEKMINYRLVWFLEKNNLISPNQFGFRKNRSTLDPILRLSNQIQQGFVEKKQTVGVFFDLEKAYDTTWQLGIIKQLQKFGVKGNMMKFIKAFLSERFLRVRVGNKMSSLYKQEEGVPQGSVLSVTCFSVAINKIIEAVPAPVRSSLFVDDFAIYYTAYDPQVASTYIQRAIESVTKWANDNGFKFSTSKTVAVCFSRRRTKEVPTTLKLNNCILPYSEEAKFLGIIFDKRLTWSSHVNILKDKAKKSLDILKVVSSHNWGADKKSLLRLYNALVRSKIDYGCQIYSSACKTTLNKLDVIHNMGLRICSGAFRTSPVESIYVDTDQIPLDLRREELSLRYINRLKNNSSNPTKYVLADCDHQKFNTSKCSKPLQIRINEEVEDQSLKNQHIMKVEYPIIPPWMTNEAQVCPKIVNKRSTPEEVIRAQFLAHDEEHHNTKKIYTDGSKTQDGVGIAIVHNEDSRIAKLSDNASIFTAELTAILKSLEYVNKIEGKRFTIYSDSYSALTAIKQFNPSHPLIWKIQEWLCWLASRYKSVQFCWVPAHVGIKGNEKADTEARLATSLEKVDFSFIPHTDMKWPIRSYIKEKWQHRWTSMKEKNLKYQKIRTMIDSWVSSYQGNRGFETRLSRLRIGHTHLTHKFLLQGDDPPMCDRCSVSLTVEHILVSCPKYTDIRRRYKISGTVEVILNDDVDVGNLMQFLKDINVFHEI